MFDRMMDALSPAGFGLVLFVAVIGTMLVGFQVGRRMGTPRQVAMESLSIALAAIFTIVALVLSFSFSFALTRYEQRWHLVVDEANDMGTMYLRASLLDPPGRDQLRRLLRAYAQDRINYLENEKDPQAQQRAQLLTSGLHDQMWAIVANAQRTRPQDLGVMLLTQETNDVLDKTAEQNAALRFRLRGTSLLLILFVALLGAVAIGITFGVSNWQNALISLGFCFLLIGLVWTIIDLDSPQSGFIRINLMPLYDARAAMR